LPASQRQRLARLPVKVPLLSRNEGIMMCGKWNLRVFGQHPMLVAGDGHAAEQAAVVLAPVGQELVELLGIDHRARQDVGADFGAFLQHADRQLAAFCIGELLQSDRALRPAGPAPTITTSYSIDSRSLIFVRLPLVWLASRLGLHRPFRQWPQGLCYMTMSGGVDVTALNRAEAMSLLSWWLDAGVDVGISEQPRNWLAPSKPLPLAEGRRRGAPEGRACCLPSRTSSPPAPGQAGGES
jgi:hypothetical protein